jgi:hypothetical protein
MIIRRLLLLAVIVTGGMVMLPGLSVIAQNPHTVVADSSTNLNNPSTVYGSNVSLFVAGDTVGGCKGSRYLWYKFDIPATSQTIGSARLQITFGAGGGTSDLELLSSDAAWSETDPDGLNWNNQPVFSNTLAIATGVTFNSTAVFSSTTFASFLDGQRGQTVSLAVRVYCPNVSPSVSFSTRSRENPSGSAAQLELFTPTSILLTDFAADTTPLNSLGMVGLGAAVIVVLALLLLVRRRWHGA